MSSIGRQQSNRAPRCLPVSSKSDAASRAQWKLASTGFEMPDDRIVAYHESGHVLAAHALGQSISTVELTDPVQVTTPVFADRGMALKRSG
jgi:hypothetical protein